jgi:hypothetical protein
VLAFAKTNPHVNRHLCFSFFLFICFAVRAEENRYDVLSKTLMPFLSIFAKDRKTDTRAFTLKVRIEQSSDLPAELNGAGAEVALQMPDKIRLHGPLFGDTFTLVREDEKIWIYPGAKAQALLESATAGKQLPPAEKKFKLSEFQLPIPEKQLVFLTALFGVKDVGDQEIDGVNCRVLDVTLMPELAKSLKVDGWVSRLWVRPDYKPARLTLARKGWNIVLRFDDVQFVKELPEETWEPSASEAGDVLRLEPKEYSRFLRGIGGGK